MSREDVSQMRERLDALGPFGLLGALGIEHKREGRTARFACLWHAERTPSATLRIGPEGSLQAHCHGACGRSWDALALVAAARCYDTRTDFPRVLQEAADLVGVSLDHSHHSGANGLRAPRARSKSKPTGQGFPPPSYPDDACDLWASCRPVTEDASVVAYLAGRALEAAAVARLDLARALPACNRYRLPSWARCAGKAWSESGHRLVVPCFDATGTLRSVRASRIGEGDSPKRLAPAGHTSTGLVFANPIAQVLLANPRGAAEDMIAATENGSQLGSVRVVIAEGEPDFMTFSTAPAWAGWAVLGVYAGSWSAELAARIPDGARVVVATHTDEAGEKYAQAIVATLAGLCVLERLLPETE